MMKAWAFYAEYEDEFGISKGRVWLDSVYFDESMSAAEVLDAEPELASACDYVEDERNGVFYYPDGTEVL